MKFLSNLNDWLKTASYSDSAVTAWMAGLILVLILAFLWSTVVRKIVSVPVKVVKEVTE
jgi:uncharacterized protein involved in cysteine biosynthesis